MRDRRLLVTGASGMIGRYIVEEALKQGFEVHAVTSRTVGQPDDAAGGAVWHVCDLTARGGAGGLIAEIAPSHLIHAAWDTRHGIYWSSPSNLAWLAATAELAASFAAAGGRRFVLVGTCAEYDWRYGLMIENETPERPDTLYGRCKLAAHHAVQGAAMDLGFSAVTGRVFSVFGPHEQPGRFIPYACRTLAAGDTPKLSTGRQIRDLLHARDIALALLVLAEHDELQGAVNIGSGLPMSLGHAARILADAAGAPERSGLGRAADRPGDPMILLPSVERLVSTGWRPQLEAEEGLRQIFAWWAGQTASAPAALDRTPS